MKISELFGGVVADLVWGFVGEGEEEGGAFFSGPGFAALRDPLPRSFYRDAVFFVVLGHDFDARLAGRFLRGRVQPFLTGRWPFRGDDLLGPFLGHQLACPLFSLGAVEVLVWVPCGHDFCGFQSQFNFGRII